MTATPFPERFPVFPLPNVVLFPDSRLPLLMFEPRYRQMTKDALEGDRVIGMVLLRPGSDASALRAPIFEVGCAGHIVESRELPDGRFRLLLSGERRFRVLSEEDADRPYRVAHCELLPDPGFGELADDGREELEGQRAALEAHVLELARASAPDQVGPLAERMRQLDPVELLHALAFGLDCGFLEKQSLLEAPDPLARAGLLARLLEFHKAEAGLPYPPRNLN